jgi:hypothetical protein
LKLTNTDYFRAEAIKFQEQGYYCKYPSDSPKGEAYWNEQAYRSYHGYKRESDGIWITGYHYFYLNFCPIELTIASKELEVEGNVHGDREVGFPAFWDGDYEFFHYVQRGEDAGLFGDVDKVRGSGYSCKGASMANRNYFLVPRSKSYLVVYDKQFLLGDGIMSKVTAQMNFIDEHTGWSKRRLIDKDLHIKSGYTVKSPTGVWIEKGFKSEIIAVSIAEDANKMRGKRGKLIIYDEAGAFPRLYKVWGTSIASMRQGRVVYGYMLAMGTGGSDYNYSMSLEDMFYNPEAYEILPVENVWDKNVPKGSKCGFFVSSSMNREGHYDKEGNSNQETATIEILKEREDKLKNGATNDIVTRHIAEFPLAPRESFLKAVGSIFPVNELNEHLIYIDGKPKEFENKEYIGKLTETSEGFKWSPDIDIYPITDFPLRNKERKEGAIVIWEHPNKSEVTGKVRDDIYIAGLDPYDDDQALTSTSLGSLIIMNLLTGRIVAEYTGRPDSAERFYENCFKLLRYYNATVNYERNKKGFYAYAKNNNFLKFLCPEPKNLRDLNLSKANTIGNNMYGTNANTEVNAFARRLINDYLISEAYGEDANESPKKNLHTLRGRALIKELIFWNEMDNFDRVSSFGMLMILRENIKTRIDYLRNKQEVTEKEDTFWTKHYIPGKRIMPLVANK